MLDASKSLRFAAGVAVGWTVLELIVRWGSVVATVVLLDRPVLGLAVGLVFAPVLAVVLTAVAREAGQSTSDWGWRLTGGALVVGVVGGLVRLALLTATPPLDAALTGGDSGGEALLTALAETSPLVLALFFVGNALLVPIAEEQVWRGILQTAVVRELGPVVGILLTAALFSCKHAVVDASPGRLVTNFVGGLVYGVVRHYWGTGASTATHVTGNALATGGVIMVAT